ncbi:ATPase [Rhodococcus sp. SRB_17]|uniref:SRPBCC family protein n=1 Tax=Rhodococcus sp. OK302 TaxID=1882769 RepID=UPI000B945E10|nr:SRPBCC family protein [Rhodococcus sp. OK302]NMM88730.1 ATPase [Rhodococcus sp. SRB_17]OYD70553.1 polyketide cyclase/dehydrase/lipid transport protein [Rhodococcus sp. OK302]
MSEVDVTTRIVIDSPPAVVAAYAANPLNTTAWYANIKDVTPHSDGPFAVGARFDFRANFLGRKLIYTYEIVEFDSTRLVMRTSDGPFPMETTYEWSATGAGSTAMVLRNRGTPSGFFTMAAPLMERAMRRANAKDLAALKRILETGR